MSDTTEATDERAVFISDAGEVRVLPRAHHEHLLREARLNPNWRASGLGDCPYTETTFILVDEPLDRKAILRLVDERDAAEALLDRCYTVMMSGHLMDPSEDYITLIRELRRRDLDRQWEQHR